MENNISNEINLKNNLENEKEQKSFLETTIGKTINTAIDIGIRTILPDYIENQIIDLKDIPAIKLSISILGIIISINGIRPSITATSASPIT